MKYDKLGFKTKKMRDFPNVVNVEVYRGKCPCYCPHCPVGKLDNKSRKEYFGENSIDLELYKKIVEEISQYEHSTIRVHSTGEPLLWKELTPALELSKNNNVNSWIFTSLVTKDKEKLEEICQNTNIIEVSINSITSEDYKKTKGIDAYDLVIKNIAYLRDYIQKNNLQTRLIGSRVQSFCKKEDIAFENHWNSSGLFNDVFIRTYHTYNDLIEQKTSEYLKENHEPCLVHWGRFNISVDGFAVVCFNELFKQEIHPSLILGDVKKQKIQEIWQGEKLNSIREAELKKDYSNLDNGEDLPCKDCTSCQPLFGNNETSENQIEQLNGDKK